MCVRVKRQVLHLFIVNTNKNISQIRQPFREITASGASHQTSITTSNAYGLGQGPGSSL